MRDIRGCEADDGIRGAFHDRDTDGKIQYVNPAFTAVMTIPSAACSTAATRPARSILSLSTLHLNTLHLNEVKTSSLLIGLLRIS